MRRGGPEIAQGGMPWPTGPQALILRAAVAPDAEVRPAFEAWKALINLDDDLDGGAFRLLPLVFDRLHGLGVDDPLMGRLKGVYRKSWSETQTLFHDMAPVIAALEAAGVKTMLLKGAPLALSYYRTVALRPMLDLDVVVPFDQADKALKVMAELGWTAGSTIRPHEMPETHAVDMRSAKGRELDLHWHCLREAPAKVADDWFWTHAEPLDFCGVQTLQPNPTALLLHTVVHGVRSNLEPPIRWIADAMTLMKARPEAIDWTALVDFAKAQKLTYRLHLGLDFLARTYGAPVPAAVLTSLKACGISLIERIENVIYLGDASQMYRPRLFPLIDYWRFLRNEPFGPFSAGFGRYLQRRWQLSSPMQIPLEAMAALRRRLGKGRAA